jgi:uncharacterized protein
MLKLPTKATILMTKVDIRPEVQNAFADWQAKLNGCIVAFAGFLSLEILAPLVLNQPEWVIIQRFHHPDQMKAWRQSKEHQELINELRPLVKHEKAHAIQETEIEAEQLASGGVTEVFVTQIDSIKDQAFREWLAKIHRVEAKFPGFRGVYTQAPSVGHGKQWITLLQFDTPKNLDYWLSSVERQQVLNESTGCIVSLENHRIISPYAGWFSSLLKKGELPAVWKQTMLVLLVLFPVVMLELKFFSLLTSYLGLSLATFISNAVSVTLIAWPLMPLAIWFLGWWLSPENNKRSKTIQGTLLVIGFYLIEIIVFWKFI